MKIFPKLLRKFNVFIHSFSYKNTGTCDYRYEMVLGQLHSRKIAPQPQN